MKVIHGIDAVQLVWLVSVAVCGATQLPQTQSLNEKPTVIEKVVDGKDMMEKLREKREENDREEGESANCLLGSRDGSARQVSNSEQGVPLTGADLATYIEQTTIHCLLRKYLVNVHQNFRFKNNTVLPCWDRVRVNICWGRCDSSEIADYKVPYKISQHKACVYERTRRRLVHLKKCHPQHPQPWAPVYDAVNCVCQSCDSENLTCE